MTKTTIYVNYANCEYCAHTYIYIYIYTPNTCITQIRNLLDENETMSIRIFFALTQIKVYFRVAPSSFGYLNNEVKKAI